MLKFSFLDSQSDTHPLAAIFLIQNSIFNSIKDSNNEMHQLILSFIPILDKSQMSQLNMSLKKHEHIKTIVKKFNLPKRFDSNMIDSFNLTIKDQNIFPESLIVSISFASVIWYYDTSSRKTKDFEDLLSFLSGLLNNNQKMNFIINYAFKKLLKGAVKCPTFQWHPTIFRVVFSHIFINTTLDKKIYKQLTNFFKIVVDFNHTDSMNEMMKLISTLVKEDRKIINWDEIQIIIFLFMPFINSLKEQALSFISLLSYKTKSPALIDTFILLPSLLLNNLDFDYDEHQFFTPVSKFQNVNVLTLPLKFSQSSFFKNGFANPTVSFFEEVQHENCSHLSENTILAVEKIADCINKASMMYRKHFFMSFGKMFTVLKNSNRYIQTCTAFVLLMANTIQSVPIELFLSILNETVLFQPEYNIYAINGLDKMINYLRNRVFQMVIDTSPPSIASFFEKTSCYPFLLTEHINRLLFLKPELFFDYFLDEKNVKIFIQSALHLYCLENNVAFNDSEKIIRSNDRKLMTETYDIKTARNDNFLFLINICKKSDLFAYEDFAFGFLWFMLEEDVSYYVLFFLRRGIADFGKKGNNDISATVDFIMKILLKTISIINNSNQKNQQQELFTNLTVSLADVIQEGLMQNPMIFKSFESLFSLFFDILDVLPSPSLLESCFKMLEIYNEIEKWKPLNLFHFRILTKSIQKIEGKNISDSTFKHLYRMLSLCSSLGNYKRFHIKKPSILPLLLSVFIAANRTIDFFNHLKILCDFSVFNAAACHDGGIDSILLDYLIKRKTDHQKNSTDEKEVLINYNGIDFTFCFTLEELKTIIFPFLVNIFKVKSDNSICTKLAKIIGEHIDEISLFSCEQLIEVISLMKSFPVPRFRIGTFNPTLKYINIPENFFVQSKFIVKFDLELDAESINSSCTSLNLFTISDNKGDNCNEITILTDQMSLLLCVKNNGVSNLKYVVRLMPHAGLNTYEFHFSTNENTFSLCAFINDEEMNYFQNLSMPHFASEKVSVSIGGYTNTLSKDWLNVELGSLSHFAIATTQNTNTIDSSSIKNDESNKNNNNNNNNIYTDYKDYFYFEGNRYNVFCIMSNIDDKHDFYVYSEKTNGIKAFINFTNLENRHNLLFYLIKGDFVNSLCQNFFSAFTDAFYPNYIKLIFDILTQIVPITQSFLNYLNIDSIMHYLSSNIDLLDSDLFLCITTLFTEISKTQNDKYSIRWFELLITNFWLWSRMKPDDFKRVLYYCCHQLIFSHPKYFNIISYFSIFLNQYYLMFCMKDDGVTREYPISDFTIFREEYTKEDIEKCREIFELFLNRVISIRVERIDIETLFAHLFSSSSIKTINTMLHLLVEIPTSALRQSQNINKHLSMLHKFFSPKYKERLNIEIIEQILILIHKLAGDKIHQHFLAAAHEIKQLYSNDKNNQLNVIDFFKSISHHIYVYPNISIFICILALNWYKSNDLDKTDKDNINSLVCSILLLICNKKDSVVLFEFCSFWYIWPILIAYTLESNIRRSISFFLSKMLIYSPNPIIEMDKIIDICNLITSSSYPKINLAFEFMKELCGIESSLFGNIDLSSESIDVQIIRHSILRCFYLIFLHFSANPINNNIYVSEKIIESEMCIFNESTKNIFRDFLVDLNDKTRSTPITTPQEFEQLICSDFSKYKMNFKVRLNKDGEWSDKEKADFILSLFQKCKIESFDTKIETIYKIIQYFLNKKDIQIDRIVVIQSSFESIFEPLTEVYGNQFNSNISAFSKLFHQLMESMYDLLFNNKISKADEYITKSHLLLEEEIARATLSSDITVIPPPIIKKSNILASDFCPHLVKRTRSKIVTPLVQNNKPLIELKCVRVKLNSIKKYTFSLYKDSFSLSGIKNVPLDEITMILARKRNYSTQKSQFSSDSGTKENIKDKDKDKEKDSAIEIFTADGRSFFLDFVKAESSTVVRYFLDVPLPNIQFIQKSTTSSPPSDVFNIPELTKKWSQGLISNFDYLMMLNIYSGRSFNDENIYPLFPSILSDFDNYTMIRDIAHHFRFNQPFNKKKSLFETLMEQQVIKPEFYYSGRMVMDPSMYLQPKSTIRSLSLPLSESAYFPYLPKALSSGPIITESSNILNNNESDETISNAIIINDSDESDHEMIMLPHWASSPFEFVYKHRLLLESKSVNEYLGDWIHEVFGPQMKIKFGHTKLFNSSKHQSRSIRPLFDLSKKPIQHFKIKNSRIIDTATVKSGPIEFKFLFLLNNGTIISMIINTSTFANPLLKVEEKISSKNLSGRFVMSSFDGNSLILSLDDRKVINLRENTVDPSNLANMANFNYPNNLSRNMPNTPSSFNLVTDTNFFFASKNGASFCPDDTTIATVKFSTSLFYYSNQSGGNAPSAQSGLDFRYGFNYMYSNEPSTSSEIQDRSKVNVVWKLNERLISIDISWRFKIAAFVTVDGFLHVGSIRNGSEINKFNIKKVTNDKSDNNQVRFIKITRNFGFIVTALLDRFLIFSVNGDFIKQFCLFSSLPSNLNYSESSPKPKITEKVIRLFALDKRGIDYIAYQNEIFEVKIFEAFYPHKIQKICEAGCLVLCIEYDPATDGYLIVRENGRVSLISSCV